MNYLGVLKLSIPCLQFVVVPTASLATSGWMEWQPPAARAEPGTRCAWRRPQAPGAVGDVLGFIVDVGEIALDVRAMLWLVASRKIEALDRWQKSSDTGVLISSARF